MKNKGLNRRQFLHTSGLAVAGAAAAGSVTMIVDPDGAWALSLNALDTHTGKTLVGVCRVAYPHDSIGDQYYARVVEALDGKAAGDSGTAKLLEGGVAELDATFNIDWLDLSDGLKLEAVERIADGAFFQTVRGTVVGTLYNDPLLWRHFGYEGSSWEFGGYKERGFDDLGWLPEV